MTSESLPTDHATTYRVYRWKEWDSLPPNDAVHGPVEELPLGTNLPRKEWVTLNRARSKVGKTGRNLNRWGLSDTSQCECGYPDQTMEHLLSECDLGPHCTDIDLRMCNTDATTWIQNYSDKI